ncbi:hypothetical protein DVR12_22160 [Chitinophaga silvatica]|uniref:DUF4595 domain-containing protein n=1 Tax=Chitinophaga silvatica TaxID=2282649 RepID=A0A3E1Y558_9BACT|nr:hypothetical protein [Chitinophaga silvatica]RFS19803.1 hypothetical protein DVR12_22160 [Chitinophaga silvatica]
MFNLKSSTVLKCAVVALFALASCSKNEDTTVPETKAPDTLYQVQAIYWGDNIVYDSFVYKENKLTEAWFYDEDEKAYMQKSIYTYNADGFLTKSLNYAKYRSNDMYLRSVDSIAWSDSKLVDYSYSFEENKTNIIGRDTTVISLDASKRMTLIGTKDTIRYSDYKQVDYLEYAFTGNNITTHTNKYYSAPNNSNIPGNEYTTVTTLEFGDLINPLQEVLIKNPILAMDLDDELPGVFLSGNNVKKITETYRGETSVYTATSQALPGTKVLSKYLFTFGEKNLTCGYKINKIVK